MLWHLFTANVSDLLKDWFGCCLCFLHDLIRCMQSFFQNMKSRSTSLANNSLCRRTRIGYNSIGNWRSWFCNKRLTFWRCSWWAFRFYCLFWDYIKWLIQTSALLNSRLFGLDPTDIFAVVVWCGAIGDNCQKFSVHVQLLPLPEVDIVAVRFFTINHM